MSVTVWIDHEDGGGTLTPVQLIAVPRVGEHISFEVVNVNPEIWEDFANERISGVVTRVWHRSRDCRRTHTPRITADYIVTVRRDEDMSDG